MLRYQHVHEVSRWILFLGIGFEMRHLLSELSHVFRELFQLYHVHLGPIALLEHQWNEYDNLFGCFFRISRGKI